MNQSYADILTVHHDYITFSNIALINSSGSAAVIRLGAEWPSLASLDCHSEYFTYLVSLAGSIGYRAMPKEVLDFRGNGETMIFRYHC
jgi:hypothetical protein